MKTLGILGGMGPLAGAYFYRRVIESTFADSDSAHLPVLLFGDPRIPDRTAHLFGRGENPLPALLAGISSLALQGAEVIAIPCNTAHAYLSELRTGSCVPILDMPQLTVDRAAEGGVGRIGILSTRGTLLSRIYHRAAEKAEIEVLTLPSHLAERLEDGIYLQKGGKATSGAAYLPYAEQLLASGSDAVVLACTEISAAFQGEAPSYCIDALEVLVGASISFCGGTQKGEVEISDLRSAFAG